MAGEAANSDTTRRFFIVTGGPGSGKSTLVDALAAKGFARSVEAGRAIIQDQMAIGGRALPWTDPAAFAELMLCWEMRSYRIACDTSGPVIFDRGMPDITGYLRLMKLPVPHHVDKAARMFRYNRIVCIAPPWPEIYRQDAERKQALDEAERTYHVLAETYVAYVTNSSVCRVSVLLSASGSSSTALLEWMLVRDSASRPSLALATAEA